MTNTTESSKKSAQGPLLPITDLLSDEMPRTASSISEEVDRVVTDGLKKVKGDEGARIVDIITGEIETLIKSQERNNEEHNKRIKEMQVIREKNLVISGAVSGLKKILASIEKK